MRGVMGMDIGNLVCIEKFANACIGLTGQSERRIAQISLRIKAAKRNRATFKDRRGLIDILRRRLRRFADIDCISRAIGRRDIMADMVEQYQALTFARILQ